MVCIGQVFEGEQPGQQAAKVNARIVTHHVHYFKISGWNEKLAAFFQRNADGQQQAAEQQLVTKDVQPPLVHGVEKQVRQRHHQAEMDGFVAKGHGADAVFDQHASRCLETHDGDDKNKDGNGRRRKDFEKHEPKFSGGA